MSRIIAIANQKGGVGKTTTTVNLGTALAMRGNKVCLIDLDPQANMSAYLGYTEELSVITINDMMLNVVRGETVTSGIIHNEENGVDYVPSNINLSSADFYLSQALARESVLKRVLSSVIFSEYDYILIDCLPSLGVLLMNALTASGDVIIPVQTQKFALNGLQGLTDVINQIKNTVNPELRIMGILPTMLDNTVMSRETLNALTNDYQSVFNTKISKSIEAAYSSQKCRSLCKDKSSKLGEEYMLLAEEVEKV